MENQIREIAAAMKQEAPLMACLEAQQKNQALQTAADALRAHKDEIFAENKKDLAAAALANVPVQVQKRLKMDEKKLEDVCAGIEALKGLPDPVGRITLQRELDEGLVLKRVSCPIGVIGVIFEARPDALVQISSLCMKSGNMAVLKGGKETANTNRILFQIIHEAGVKAGLPEHFIALAQTHSEIDELLGCDREIDLIIPRGSNRFVRYIMDHTNIPVMGHSDGICHIFVDQEADPADGYSEVLKIITDAKTQYPVACNAAETVLVHREIAPVFLPALKKAMDAAGVRLHVTKEAAGLLSGAAPGASGGSACSVFEGVGENAGKLQLLTEDQFRTEYGDLDLSVVVVSDVKEAAEHINRYGSHHTDSILTRDDAAADYFLRMVDSAGVYRNCSTRFADGFRYGFGAEVGISTGKLHARGPVGLDGLVTYKYELTGSGQIVGDYASGKASFHFKDL